MKLKSLLLSLCLSISALTSFADDIGAFPGYVASPNGIGSGTVVKTQYGECVHNQYYKPDYAVDGCDGYEAESPVANAPVVLVESATTLFAFNSSILSESGKKSLTDSFNKLSATSIINSIDIVGYTDALGSNEHNQKLSNARALSVKDFISGLGINGDIISAHGVGESKTIVSQSCFDTFGNDRQDKIDEVSAKIKKTKSKKAKKQLETELSNLEKSQADLENCTSPDRRVEITIDVTEKQ